MPAEAFEHAAVGMAIGARRSSSYVIELEKQEHVYPHALWDEMTKMGLHGLGIAEEYGGSGGTPVDSAIAAYLEMGAVGVQLGTRFVCATESIAHPNFKKVFIRASARDAILSVQIDPRLPVIPVRALKNREMEKFAAKQREVAQLLDEGAIEMAEAQLQIEHYWAGALRRAVIDGDVESVNGDGTITVSDYNLAWDGLYRNYTRSASGLTYIYF